MDPITLLTLIGTMTGVLGVVASIYYGEKQTKPTAINNQPEDKKPMIPPSIIPNEQPNLDKPNKHIFISYSSKEQEINLIEQFYEKLTSDGHEVFMAAKSIKPGDNWVERIDQELNQCDYFLLFVSPNSANSEMVMEEFRRAKEFNKSRDDNTPIILIIMINIGLQSLNYMMRSYIFSLQYLQWKSDKDTAIIIEKICKILANPDSKIDEKTDYLEDFPPLKSLPPSPFADPQKPLEKYIERPPIESQCYQEIVNSNGCLIRIRSSQKMGKTALVTKIIDHAKKQNYHIVSLSFQLAEKDLFHDLNKLLKWFCTYISKKLRIPDQVSESWTELLGSKANCEQYFQEHILSQLNAPLVLILEEIDQIFPYPIAQDFFAMLRPFHESGRKGEMIWQKLRLVLVHSTEVYIKFPDINMSPFNVGLRITLPDFTQEQVKQLAKLYDKTIDLTLIEFLMAEVGGHPYLLSQAFYYLQHHDVTIENILQDSSIEENIYKDHLKKLFWEISQYPDLVNALTKIIRQDKNIELEEIQIFKLESLGLVHQEMNQIKIRYNLYNKYFSQRLGVKL